MSGAQWSPAQLLNMADVMALDFPSRTSKNQIAAALLDFARVVSVLEQPMWPDSVQISVVPSGIRARLGVVAVEADTSLAAILSLADALDAGRGDA